MDELRALLLQVEDTYEDFVTAMLYDAGKDASKKERLISYIKDHPTAHTDDILEYIEDLPSTKEVVSVA